MADVILNTDELIVLGGPSSITVDTNIGAQGPRGSRIFAGNGNPNDPNTVIGQTPNIFDLYINLLASDEQYLYLYQYLLVDSSTTWVPLVKLIPNSYSDNNYVDFVGGLATVDIPLISIVNESSIATLSPDNFNVVATANSTNPIAISVSLEEDFIEIDEILNLRINLSAAEYSSGTWANASGNKIVYLQVTLGQQEDLIS